MRQRQQPARNDRADHGGVADRQVDLAQQQHEDFGHAQHDDPRGLGHQVDQVSRGQEERAAHLEVDDDGDQPDDDRKRAALPATDPPPPDSGVLTERVGDDLGSGHLGRRLFGRLGLWLVQLSAHWGSLEIRRRGRQGRLVHRAGPAPQVVPSRPRRSALRPGGPTCRWSSGRR